MKRVAKIYNEHGTYYGDIYFHAFTKRFTVCHRGCAHCYAAETIEEVEEFLTSEKRPYWVHEIKYLKSFKRA